MLRMNYSQFMSSIPLRDDILDDLTYLQKHLRLLIKYHQVRQLTRWSSDFCDSQLM